MGSGKVVLGVLAGFAAGAVAGILLAPEKGSETRRRIAYKADNLTDDLEEKFSEFISSVTKQFEDLRKQAAAAADDAKEQVEETIADTTPQA